MKENNEKIILKATLTNELEIGKKKSLKSIVSSRRLEVPLLGLGFEEFEQ